MPIPRYKTLMNRLSGVSSVDCLTVADLCALVLLWLDMSKKKKTCRWGNSFAQAGEAVIKGEAVG